MSFKILTLNHISVRGLDRLPRDRYEIASEIGHPDAILLRSADMHDMEIPASVLAVARAGAGTNNIPVGVLSRRGVPVFNSPGANANAVKELVLAGLFLAARNICQAWKYVGELKGDDDAIEEAVEKGKKRFVGFELPGRTLGVVGLGAIGVEVANAALGLRMKTLGYDPQITVQRAWQLSSGVEQALSLDDLFARSDMVTVHVPLVESTRGLVNAARLRLMRPGGVLLNFARAGIVDETARFAGLDGRNRLYRLDIATPAASLFQSTTGVLLDIGIGGGVSAPVELPLRAEVIGRFLDSRAKPLKNVSVGPRPASVRDLVTSMSTALPQTVTDEDGRFAIRVDRGKYDFAFVPPQMAMPTLRPANRSGKASRAARPAAPAPSVTSLALSASMAIACSTARSGTTSTSRPRRRISASGASPTSRTAMPSAMVGPPTRTGAPARRCAMAG